MKQKPIVKVIAIAKDEAAYLPEWIHHHLYLGVESITVLVNRTSDNTSEVLNNITAQYRNVSWGYIDWVDQCPGEAKSQIQFIGYASALSKAREAKQFTHVLFLDIDEYLILDGMNKDISSFISEFEEDSLISLEWLNDSPEQSKAFMPLPRNLKGNLSPLVKTIYPIDAEFEEMRHHVSKMKRKYSHFLASGDKFKGRSDVVQALVPELNSLKSSFIYHRANRSQDEYISLLFRGRPGDSFSYKSNRRGFPNSSHKTLSYDIGIDEYTAYQDSFESFKTVVSFEATIGASKEFVLNRKRLSLSSIRRHLHLDFKLMKRLFSGISNASVIREFSKYRSENLSLDAMSVEDLVAEARQVKETDTKKAIKLLNKAKEKRPNGPIVNKMLRELSSRSDEK